MDFFTNRRIEALVCQANQLKLQGRWLEAGDAFREVTELHRQMGSRQAVELMAISLGDAANCYKKADQRYAILAMETAASLWAQLGQFCNAAAIHKAIAESALAIGLQDEDSWLMLGGPIDEARKRKLEALQLAGGHNDAAAKSCRDTDTSSRFDRRSVAYMKSFLPRWSASQSKLQQGGAASPTVNSVSKAPSATRLAIRHYQLAADRFSAENLPARECECLKMRAELLTKIGELEAAADQFLELASRALRHELLAFGAVNHVFKACLCRLQAASLRIDGAESPEQLLAQAEAACPAFTRAEEAAFIREIAGAVRAGDVAALDGSRRRFEEGNCIDDFCLERLCGLRKALSEEVQLT